MQSIKLTTLNSTVHEKFGSVMLGFSADSKPFRRSTEKWRRSSEIPAMTFNSQIPPALLPAHQVIAPRSAVDPIYLKYLQLNLLEVLSEVVYG